MEVVRYDVTMAVRTGEIGDRQTGVMGDTIGNDAVEHSNSDGRDDTLCHTSADGPIYGDGSVRAIWH